MAVDANQLYSTYKTFLMVGTVSSGSTTWEKLIDIRDYPEMGGDPDFIDMTTLSNGSKIGVNGIQNNEALAFTANYNPTTFATLKTYDDGNSHKFALWLGGTVSGSTVTPDGSEGKFEWDGTLSCHLAGGGVNEGRTVNISITPNTDIAFSVPT